MISPKETNKKEIHFFFIFDEILLLRQGGAATVGIEDWRNREFIKGELACINDFDWFFVFLRFAPRAPTFLIHLNNFFFRYLGILLKSWKLKCLKLNENNNAMLNTRTYNYIYRDVKRYVFILTKRNHCNCLYHVWLTVCVLKVKKYLKNFCWGFSCDARGWLNRWIVEMFWTMGKEDLIWKPFQEGYFLILELFFQSYNCCFVWCLLLGWYDGVLLD